MYPSLSDATSFLTGKGQLKRKIAVQYMYDTLGPKHASAMLGFHAFTGSDMFRKFAGRTPKSGASRCSCLVMMRFWKHLHH